MMADQRRDQNWWNPVVPDWLGIAAIVGAMLVAGICGIVVGGITTEIEYANKEQELQEAGDEVIDDWS